MWRKEGREMCRKLLSVPGGDGDGAEVEVVPDGVLKVVVHPALGEAGVQVLAEITGDGAWKTWTVRIFQTWKVQKLMFLSQINLFSYALFNLFPLPRAEKTINMKNQFDQITFVNELEKLSGVS